ncbi:MAG: protein kinase, partial [Pseudomonadota bacterium]
MVDPFAPFSQDGFRFGEAPPPPPGAPESANWTALRRMTRGGQGEVWQVRHVLTGRYGTLKLAPTDREERLRRESQALESVNHPNVARFLEVGMTRDHRRYLVYEFVEGPDLSEALRRDGPFAPEAVRASLCAVLDGLSALHAKGLIHRDVKPANIVMSPMRGPVLVDFGAIGRLNDYGLAGYEDGRTTKRMATTQIGQIAGSPRYMSPEQATGAPQTPMTDIWGVGLVAGEMLTGRPMVRGHALNDALIQVMRAEFDFGDIHSAFRPFLEACLQIEAPDRPQTAYDAIALLPKGPVPGAAAPRPIEPDPARAPAPIPQDWGLDDLLSADFKVREPERGDPFADVPDRAPPTQPLPPRRPPEAKPIDRAESPKPAESPARGPASRPPPAAIPDTWPDPAPETVIRPLPRNAPSLSAPAERRARVSSMPVLLLVVLLA